VVGNLVQDGMGGDDNTVVMLDDRGRHPLGPAPKIDIARGIVAHIGQMLAGKGRKTRCIASTCGYSIRAAEGQSAALRHRPAPPASTCAPASRRRSSCIRATPS
jgi:hypothetical protein